MEEGEGRLMPSGYRDRLVDCMEEFVKYTIVMRPYFDLFGDRFSERSERLAARKAVQMEELVALADAEQGLTGSTASR